MSLTHRFISCPFLTYRIYGTLLINGPITVIISPTVLLTSVKRGGALHCNNEKFDAD